jgi:hypothetical protein
MTGTGGENADELRVQKWESAAREFVAGDQRDLACAFDFGCMGHM